MRATDSRGFTLLELLVVIGIAGLLVAVVPPFLPKVVDSMQVRAAARELAATLREARGRAIVSGRTLAVSMDVEGRRYSSPNRSRKMTLPRGTAITLTTAASERINESAGSIRFYPDGSSTGGRIVMRSGETAYAIDVSWLTGGVTVSP